MSEDLQMQDVPPDFVPPPPAESPAEPPDESYAEYGEPPPTFPPVHVCCSVCPREYDMRSHDDRASIVRYQDDKVNHVYCCACVPAEKTGLIIGHLTRELYKVNLKANRQQADITRLQDEILKSEEEKATLKRKLEKARKALHAEMDDNDKLRHVMRKIRDELQAVMAQARAVMTSRRANFVTTAKRMLNFMNSKCCELYSLSRHTLSRIGRMKPIQPSLREYDSVHPISITENEESGQKSIAFCMVCRGLDDGDHLAHQHVPRIATILLTGDRKADEDAWQTLAVPFNEQPIAIQTNGLVQST